MSLEKETEELLLLQQICDSIVKLIEIKKENINNMIALKKDFNNAS